MRQLAAIAMLVAACTQQPPAPGTAVTATTATSAAEAPVQTGSRIVFPSGYVLHVEVVADAEMRAQGLMFRDHLKPDSGMIFFFPGDDLYSFWMKNTLIPLDMIWIDANKKIVGIRENVPPCKIENCPSYDAGVDARYVLEVAGGEAAKHGFKVGDMLRFEGMDHVVAR